MKLNLIIVSVHSISTTGDNPAGRPGSTTTCRVVDTGVIYLITVWRNTASNTASANENKPHRDGDSEQLRFFCSHSMIRQLASRRPMLCTAEG